jgi:uncharacterized protein (TIGR02646 family)
MIKIDKSSTVPAELLLPKVQVKREQLLKSQKTWSKLSKSYNAPYQNKAVVKVLEELYHKKCCFCEQPIRVFSGNKQPHNARTVEHYRPKSTYRWLAYSWDNLLLCCDACNNGKSNEFPIKGTKITEPSANDLLIANIHNLTVRYQAIEIPTIPNPELENPQDFLIFDNKGGVTSNNNRYNYLINLCKLNEREELIAARKKIYDTFKDEYDLIQLSNATVEERQIRLKNLVSGFVNKCQPKENFTAYRKYVLEHYIKSLLV